MEMAGAAQSAVDSLLGRLSSMFLDEARLLTGVHDDVQFIKDEMESMKGFLLDVDDAGHPNHQVKAWMKQVREVAYDSQNCIDRYVQTFGASRPSAGLLGSLGRVPQLAKTMPRRHRIATEIQGLKARAREVGERRHRYGVTVPPPAARVTTGGHGAAEKEGERRRRALADAADLLNIDARASAAVAWLRGDPEASDGYQPAFSDFADALKNLSHSSSPELAKELLKLMRWVLGDKDPQNIGEAFSVLSDMFQKKVQELGLPDWVKGLLVGRDHARKSAADAGSARKSAADAGSARKSAADAGSARKSAADAGSPPQEEEKKSDESSLWEMVVQDDSRLIEWLQGVFGSRAPPVKLLAIVTPPVDLRNPEVDQPHTYKRATELASSVFKHPRAKNHFDCMVWVDARHCSQPRQRLECILQQVVGPSQDHDQMSRWGVEELEKEILEHLKGKRRFLIVLADHEDHAPWEHIRNALPSDHSDSAIIVTPLIQQTPDYYGWYLASWVFLFRKSVLKVYFHSYLDAVRKKADELLKGSDRYGDSRGTVDNILKKCHWDPFSTKLILHALYENPHRSKEDLDKLLLSLNEFNTASNAKQILKFYYDDLPNHYKSCLLYLSIFPQGSEIRRTSLVRRWAAENLITKRQGRSALDEAELCFNTLLARGLVLPSDIGHAGEVKSCTVDPHVFSFITKMARDKNVWDTDLPHDLAKHLSIRNGIHPQQLYKKKQQAASSNNCWRIHRHPTPTDLDDSKDSLDDRATFLVNLLSASSQLGLVKVLDLEGCKGMDKRNLKNICNKLFQLVYLSLRNTDVTKLPKEIDKLRYLETFDIRQTKVQSLPATATTLPKLVHLLAGHIESDESFSTVRMPRGIGRMTNIQILSHVEVSQSADEHELEDVGRLEQLRRLGVVIHGKEDHFLKTLLRVIGKLNECLRSLSVRIEPRKRHGEDVGDDMNTADNTFSPPKSLASLNINGWITGLPTWIEELHQLSKITLCGTYLTDSDIQILGKLANLRCISLRRESYNDNDKKLALKRKEFKRLEFLVIEGSDINHIHFEQDAAPKLEKIVWSLSTSTRVKHLSGIEKLPSLKRIELNGNCDQSQLSQIAKDMEANPNHPILAYNPTPEATAAGSSSVSK